MANPVYNEQRILLHNNQPANGWFYILVGYDENDIEKEIGIFDNEDRAEQALGAIGYEGDVLPIFFQEGKRIIEK